MSSKKLPTVEPQPDSGPAPTTTISTDPTAGDTQGQSEGAKDGNDDEGSGTPSWMWAVGALAIAAGVIFYRGFAQGGPKPAASPLPPR